MLKLYTPSNAQSYYNLFTTPVDIKKQLDMVCLPDANITIDGDRYGVFSKSGEFISESLHIWGCSVPHAPRKLKTDKVPYYDVDAIYCGGSCFFHFGHFLLQGLTRLWPHLQNKYKNMKYVFIGNQNKIPGFAKQLLHLVGLNDDNIIILEKSAVFRRLYVPQQSFDLNKYSSVMQAKVFATIAANVERERERERADKIYVSRAKLGTLKVYGEETVQRIFEKNGFRIIYPETMSVADQVACVSNCKVLAGCAGTALHLAAFMKPGGTVIQIKRNSGAGDSSYAQNLLNQTARLNCIIIYGSIETEQTGHCTNAPHFIGVTPYMRQFFDDYGFNYSTRDLKHPAKIINQYNQELVLYKRKTRYTKLKKSIAKAICCFIPGRRNRKKTFEYIKRLLHTYNL